MGLYYSQCVIVIPNNVDRKMRLFVGLRIVLTYFVRILYANTEFLVDISVEEFTFRCLECQNVFITLLNDGSADSRN